MGGEDITSLWREQVAREPGPLYQAIVGALSQSIRSGALREGDRLPTQRQVAGALGIDLTTVTRAFNEAKRLGLVDATVGRGSFVRSGAGASTWRGERQAIVDLTMNLPPILETPSLARLVEDGVSRLLRRQEVGVLMSYRMTAGTAAEREAGARWLEPLLGRRSADEVLVAPGAQSAMLAVVSSVLQSGDVLVVERFTYPGIRALAAQLRLTLCGVAMDEQGMRPDDLDRVLRETKARLAYCNPNIQNPTTATMPLDRRQAILAVLRRHHALMLEDDPYGLLIDSPLPALARLDPARVFHVATLAKTLSPGLRTAFLVAPGPDHVQRLIAALRATSLMAPGLQSELVTQWIRGGQARALLDAIRAELVRRQRVAAETLGAPPCAHPQGPHIWLQLPPHWRSAEFVDYVHRRGLALVASDVFTVEGEPPPRVRIALGTASSLAALQTALASVSQALRHKRLAGYEPIV